MVTGHIKPAHPFIFDLQEVAPKLPANLEILQFFHWRLYERDKVLLILLPSFPGLTDFFLGFDGVA